jgi:hypothetical protein
MIIIPFFESIIIGLKIDGRLFYPDFAVSKNDIISQMPGSPPKKE